MKLFICILLFFLFSKSLFSKDIFDTNFYILKFNSENIVLEKKLRIDEIKIKSLESIFINILTIKEYSILQKKFNSKFVNQFILNLTINDEKIVNNNYYSKVKINFNKNSITKYLVNNEINFTNYLPNKFLILIHEEDGITNNFLSKKNTYYKHLITNINNYLYDYQIPNLDYNDRFIFNKNNYKIDLFNKINKLNIKYKNDNQILINSFKKNNIYNIKYFFLDNNKKYLINEINTKELFFESIFNDIYIKSIDQWKIINQIDTKLINSINCKIKINNINELKFVADLLKSNNAIKKLTLKSIQINQNLYNIVYFGNINILIKSLNRNRLNLEIKNNDCNIIII